MSSSQSTRYRGRHGRSTYGGGVRTFGRPPTAPEWHPTDLGKLIKSISKDDLDSSTETGVEAAITGLRSVASYNWIAKEQTPQICVPGAPARWTPPYGPARSLTEDSGTFYRDINAAMNPRFPIQAAVKAVLARPESIDRQTIKLFACASSLTNLYRFINGETKTFRFAVEAIGNTVFFVRQEQSPRQEIENVHGYGHSMRDAYTTWHFDMQGSVSHQRIIEYTLAGLKILVRYEPDGYLPDEAPGSDESFIPKDARTNHKTDDGNDLATLLAATDWKSLRAGAPIKGASLEQITAGMDIPQSATFDLKTRSIRKIGEDLLGEFDISMWLKQVPWMIQAYHSRGEFDAENIHRVDVRPNVAKWEKENAKSIVRLGEVLKRIIAIAKKQSDGRLDVFRSAGGVLELRGGSTGFEGVLPAEDRDAWLKL